MEGKEGEIPGGSERDVRGMNVSIGNTKSNFDGHGKGRNLWS